MYIKTTTIYFFIAFITEIKCKLIVRIRFNKLPFVRNAFNGKTTKINKHITVNKMLSVSLNKTFFLSFFFQIKKRK